MFLINTGSNLITVYKNNFNGSRTRKKNFKPNALVWVHLPQILWESNTLLCCLARNLDPVVYYTKWSRDLRNPIVQWKEKHPKLGSETRWRDLLCAHIFVKYVIKMIQKSLPSTRFCCCSCPQQDGNKRSEYYYWNGIFDYKQGYLIPELQGTSISI